MTSQAAKAPMPNKMDERDDKVETLPPFASHLLMVASLNSDILIKQLKNPTLKAGV
jgi:hypothetical protein